MYDDVDRAERLLGLIASFLAAPRPVPFSEILSWFPASYGALDDRAALKKFDRDRRALFDLGVAVESARNAEGDGADGYFVDRQSAELPEIDLTREERAAT